ncbi:lycopene cyclase domain-containing protein [Halobaculum lipolyticum]|uniref:Lycopene cyclase domain-containing protein n=1 Tax=Halobaculum lipolyticum TaxID=3032001 RepID=A0ABD5WDU1_9EURY|nr:lycopene cyclase domain-containing protein [Halobaculum sp. DT31]
MTLTYLGFHLLFVLPVVGLLLWRRPALPARRLRVARAGLALMGTLAFVYTTPWDNALIERGAWFYGEGTVAARVWAAPVGEYLFFVLQTTIVGLWLYRAGFDPTPTAGDTARLPRVAGALGWLALGAAGGWLVVAAPERFLYLGAVLVWACPVIALQWAVGGAFLLRRPRQWVVGVAVPTLYLVAVDRVAIGLGVWTIDDATSTGATVLGLPVEEAVFFLLTTTLVVYGLILLEWVVVKLDRRGDRAGRAAGADRTDPTDRDDRTDTADRDGAPAE